MQRQVKNDLVAHSYLATIAKMKEVRKPTSHDEFILTARQISFSMSVISNLNSNVTLVVKVDK